MKFSRTPTVDLLDSDGPSLLDHIDIWADGEDKKSFREYCRQQVESRGLSSRLKRTEHNRTRKESTGPYYSNLSAPYTSSFTPFAQSPYSQHPSGPTAASLATPVSSFFPIIYPSSNVTTSSFMNSSYSNTFHHPAYEALEAAALKIATGPLPTPPSMNNNNIINLSNIQPQQVITGNSSDTVNDNDDNSNNNNNNTNNTNLDQQQQQQQTQIYNHISYNLTHPSQQPLSQSQQSRSPQQKQSEVFANRSNNQSHQHHIQFIASSTQQHLQAVELQTSESHDTQHIQVYSHLAPHTHHQFSQQQKQSQHQTSSQQQQQSHQEQQQISVGISDDHHAVVRSPMVAADPYPFLNQNNLEYCHPG